MLVFQDFEKYFSLVNLLRDSRGIPPARKNQLFLFLFFNPLSPNSDHRQISPCNINALSIREIMRIQDMIIKDELC